MAHLGLWIYPALPDGVFLRRGWSPVSLNRSFLPKLVIQNGRDASTFALTHYT